MFISKYHVTMLNFCYKGYIYFHDETLTSGWTDKKFIRFRVHGCVQK